MKKFLFTAAALLAYVLAFAQETARYRITYDCDMPNATGTTATYRWVLDIGDTTALFYNQDYRAYMEELDGMRATGDAMSLIAKIQRLGRKYPVKTSLQVAIGTPKSGVYTYYGSIQSSSLNYEEPLPAIAWQVTDSVRTICEYPCSQAIGTLYGRTWTVWYSTELPLDYGPYVLHGLPGLILAARDTEGIYDFQAVGIEMAPKHTQVAAVYKKNEFMKCTRRQFLKLRSEAEGLTNMEKLKRAGVAIIEIRDKDGKDITHAVAPKRNHLDKE